YLLKSRQATTLSGRLWLAAQTVCGIAPRALSARVTQLSALHRFLDGHALVLHEEHCYSSGELVAKALERGGFIWDRDPAHVTPPTLFERYSHADSAPQRIPVSLQARRRVRGDATTVRREAPASITRLTPRTTQGANALAQEPQRFERP